MITSPYNRRNFLSSLAILSAGTAFGSSLKHFSAATSANDLQKEWTKFWKKSGGRVYYSLTGQDGGSNNKDTKGHSYKYGEMIYFPKENFLAQPTWIFWNGRTKAADVVITLFENNHLCTPVIRYNRYEMDALYRLSKEPGSEGLLSASLNNGKRNKGASAGVITTTTRIKKNLHTQDISYYKEQLLIFKGKIILHT
jgi:hypothetical protein